MKYYCFLILFLLFVSCFAQDSLNYYNQQIKAALKKNEVKRSDALFQKKLNYLKNNDNLEEYYYAHFDYFLTNAKAERVKVLTNAINLNWRSAKTNNERIAHLHILANIAYHAKKFGDLKTAISYDEKAYFYYKKHKVLHYDIVENCLKRLGNNYLRIDDFTRAEEVFKNTIILLEKSKNKQHLIATYLNLSNLYHVTNQLNKSNGILLKLLNNPNLPKNTKGNIYLQLANNYFNTNDLDKTNFYLEKTYKLKLNPRFLQKILLLDSKIYVQKKQYEIATKPLVANLKLTKDIYGKNSRELAKLYLNIGQLFFLTNNYKEALKNYQNALKTLIPSFNANELYNNPKATKIVAENTFISIFEEKAKVFEIQKKYQNAIDNLQLASKVAFLLNERFTNQQSKITQQTENRNRTEKMVLLYYKLYQETKNNTYLESSFLEIEKNKAGVLNEELFRKNQYKSLTDSLFIQKRTLKKQLAILQKDIIVEEYKSENANINYLKSVLAKKTALQSEWIQLQEKIEQKFPLKNRLNELTITKIQEELLLDNQLLISYFETKTNWFIYSLSKNKQLQLRVLEKTETLEKEINHYINFFFNGNDQLIKNDVKTYQKTAFYLYKKLLQVELNESFEYLTIIPDKKLNFIAFDGLLTAETSSTNFANFPYLVKKHVLNASFSTTVLWLQKQQKQSFKTTKFVGYFPVFKNNNRKLQHLPYTLEERKYFETATNGNSFTEEKATKQHFLTHFKDYKSIHLSTHASAGSLEQPAVIEFYDETLYLPEIYGLHIQSDLLVLSACETGVGKMLKGEGVMSLSRGFTYAGVQNLVASLWKVNDKATSELMKNFYQNLKSNTKTKALQQAKMDYLNDATISSFKKSPYYWSSFVFVGNVEVNSTNYTIYFIVFGLLFLSFLIYFFIRRK